MTANEDPIPYRQGKTRCLRQWSIPIASNAIPASGRIQTASPATTPAVIGRRSIKEAEIKHNATAKGAPKPWQTQIWVLLTIRVAPTAAANPNSN
jgi:hypothetical protein